LEYTTNGSSWTSIATGLSGEQFPYVTGGTTTENFGQSTLSYSVPSGYAVLSTGNLPTPTIVKPAEYFDVLTYSGSGAKTFDNGDTTMQPDLVWVKARGDAYDHELTDSVRGVTKSLSSNATNVESTDSTGLTVFGSDGFTVGAGTNYSTSSMVAWNWKESATAAFDIITWTGDGGMGGQAVSHGLGVVPEMIIVKSRTSTIPWIVHHKDLSHSTYNKYLTLNETAAEASYSSANAIGTLTDSSVTFDNSMDMMTMTFISLNFGAGPGGFPPATDYVAYMFASVEGYSKVGSFSGSSTAFIYTGFRPSFILAKRSDSTGNWLMFDDQREGYNVDNDALEADSSAVEATTDHIDILSNGFKIRTSDSDLNTGTVIYYAVAESPFKYASAR
jgi:hypothetical protein